MFVQVPWALPNTEVPAGSPQGGPGSSESGVWRKRRLGLPRRGLYSASDGKPAAAEHLDCGAASAQDGDSESESGLTACMARW